MWQTKGHDSVIDFIKNSIESKRLAHAFLISGPSYTGKTTLAFDIAKAVNCLYFIKNNAPCEECKNCIRISSGTHTDIHILDFLNSKSSPIDQLREDFLAQIYKKPYEGKHKVFIISYVDRMRSEHANLLLKTLEEPPEDVIVILISEDISNILDTILSRCQTLDMYPVSDVSFLENMFDYADHQLPDNLDSKLIVKLSRGRIGWIYRVISNPDLFFNMQNLFDDMESAIENSVEARLKFSDRLAKNFKNTQPDGFSDIDIMTTWWRDILMILIGNETEVININRLDHMKYISSHFTTDNVVRIIKMFDSAKLNLRLNTNPLLVYDNLFLSIPSILEA